MSEGTCTGPSARTDARSVWRLARVGVLGAVTLVAMEFLNLPRGLELGERLEVARNTLVQWTLCAIAIAALAAYAERRLRAPAIAALLVAFALGASVLLLAFRYLCERFHVSYGTSIYGGASPPLPTFLYNLWVLLFFGGLFMAACVLGLRAERIRHARTAAQIARSRSETLLAEARLRALQAHVDPAFLLRVMAEVERRYANAAGDADHLLQRLVAFLRQAMPGVRGRHATLGTEAELAAAYGELWSDLAPARARWQVALDAQVAHARFPPLWLLPVLDRFADAAPEGACGTLRIERRDDRAWLTLDAPGASPGIWMPHALAYRLRVALQQAFGDAWKMTVRPAADAESPALVVVFPLVEMPAPAVHTGMQEAPAPGAGHDSVAVGR